MRRRPCRLAIAFAGAAIGGLVAMALIEGRWSWTMLAVAACPMALAAFGRRHGDRSR